jgi:hypothetical protein
MCASLCIEGKDMAGAVHSGCASQGITTARAHAVVAGRSSRLAPVSSRISNSTRQRFIGRIEEVKREDEQMPDYRSTHLDTTPPMWPARI